MKNLLLLLMIATFATEEKNSKLPLEQQVEQLVEQTNSSEKKFEFLFAYLRDQNKEIKEQNKEIKEQNKEIQDLKRLLFGNVSPIGLLCQNAESQIMKQKYDRQIEPKSKIEIMQKLQKNAQGFLTERDNVKFNLVQSTNEPVEITDISLNFNAKSEIMQEPESCAICYDFIEDNLDKFTSDCKHLYHSECIYPWLKKHKNCPRCRNEIHMSQVWITLDDYLKAKNRPYTHFNQNLRIGQIADHENQQNQVQEMLFHEPQQVAIENQQNQLQNVQIVHHQVNQQNQLQNVQIVHQVNQQNQVAKPTRCEMCILYSSIYLVWSILQAAIVSSFFYIPKWHNWFPGMQILNGLSLLFVLFSHCTKKEGLIAFHLVLAIVFGLIALVLTYHSVMGELLTGMNLAHAIFWPDFLVIFLPCAFSPVKPLENEHGNVPSKKEYYFTASIWLFIQILIVLGRELASKWILWFGWMQGFHIITLILLVISKLPQLDPLNREYKLMGVWWFLVIFGLLTYHSIGSVQLKGSAVVHYNFWPWFVFISLFPWGNSPPTDWFPRWQAQTSVYFMWILVQIGIILAYIYVPKWAVWYEFMQGFHLYVFFLYLFAWLKYPKKIKRLRGAMFFQASVFHILIPIFSYHSITVALLSGDFLIHATIWPYVTVIVLAIFSCVACADRNNQLQV